MIGETYKFLLNLRIKTLGPRQSSKSELLRRTPSDWLKSSVNVWYKRTRRYVKSMASL